MFSLLSEGDRDVSEGDTGANTSSTPCAIICVHCMFVNVFFDCNPFHSYDISYGSCILDSSQFVGFDSFRQLFTGDKKIIHIFLVVSH